EQVDDGLGMDGVAEICYLDVDPGYLQFFRFFRFCQFV
ncbi:MAG: hypothetical protein RL761_1660, partial [Pseudomonadota bacterium]